MKLAVGVLTHNAIEHGRVDLIRTTLGSLLEDGAPIYLVDNGSTDGTDELVRGWGGAAIRDAVSTCGHGMNVVIGACVASGADVVVFSNDDISWHPGWAEKVRAFWSEAPEDLLICSGSLEPEYPWNTPRAAICCGGVKALVRDTAPGGTWTLRAEAWKLIGPVPETPGVDDVPTCQRLNALGYRVAQMDVATHIGEDASTWGNESWRLAQPLDRQKWGLG